jgi:hypothetical protein
MTVKSVTLTCQPSVAPGTIAIYLKDGHYVQFNEMECKGLEDLDPEELMEAASLLAHSRAVWLTDEYVPTLRTLETFAQHRGIDVGKII